MNASTALVEKALAPRRRSLKPPTEFRKGDQLSLDGIVCVVQSTEVVEVDDDPAENPTVVEVRMTLLRSGETRVRKFNADELITISRATL